MQVRAEVLAAGKDSLAALNRSHAAEVEHMMRSHVEEVMSLEVGGGAMSTADKGLQIVADISCLP